MQIARTTVVNYRLAQDPEGCMSIVVLAKYGARAGSSGHSDQFLHARRKGAAGKYSFRKCATQTELAECPPGGVCSLWPQDGCTYVLAAAKAKCVRKGDIFRRADRRYWIRRADIGKIKYVHPMHVYVAVRQEAVAQKHGSSCKAGRSKASRTGTAIKMMIDSIGLRRSRERLQMA